MKVQIKKEISEEIDFPVPSYWKDKDTHYVVGEDKILQVSKGAVIVWNNGPSYKSKAAEIFNNKCEQTDELAFLSAYNETLRQFDEVMNQPVY